MELTQPDLECGFCQSVDKLIYDNYYRSGGEESTLMSKYLWKNQAEILLRYGVNSYDDTKRHYEENIYKAFDFIEQIYS